MNDARRNGGFSVIELVSAAAILSVAVLMIVGAFFGAANLARRTRENNACKSAVESIYEEAKAIGAVAFCDENEIEAVSENKFDGTIENEYYSVGVMFEKQGETALYKCVITPADGDEFKFLCVG